MQKPTFFSGCLLLSLLFCLLFMSPARAADPAIAQVLTAVPGTSLIRNGQSLPLEQFTPLLLSDTVTTDATGRARILFNDDSTVDIGADTSLDLREFADSGTNPVFNIHLLQGVARVITGKIVEANPQGFSVSTPEGNIGIRGTSISVRTGNGSTTVYVENTTREVYVNGINVPGGQKITIPNDPIRPEPIQPQDRRNLGRELAFRGGSGVAAAAPEPVPGSGLPQEQLRPAQLAAVEGLIPPDTTLADVSLPTQSLGDSLLAGGGGGGGGGGTALVSGSLATTPGGPSTFGGSVSVDSTAALFSFDVNLANGDITNAQMHGLANEWALTWISYDATGGTGTLSGGTSGTATINGFGGTAISDVNGAYGPPYTFTINPSTQMNISTADVSYVGGSVQGSYTVNAISWGTVDSGDFLGTRQP
jgi:hypothetical protein